MLYIFIKGRLAPKEGTKILKGNLGEINIRGSRVRKQEGEGRGVSGGREVKLSFQV